MTRRGILKSCRNRKLVNNKDEHMNVWKRHFDKIMSGPRIEEIERSEYQAIKIRAPDCRKIKKGKFKVSKLQVPGSEILQIWQK